MRYHNKSCTVKDPHGDCDATKTKSIQGGRYSSCAWKGYINEGTLTEMHKAEPVSKIGKPKPSTPTGRKTHGDYKTSSASVKRWIRRN